MSLSLPGIAESIGHITQPQTCLKKEEVVLRAHKEVPFSRKSTLRMLQKAMGLRVNVISTTLNRPPRWEND